MAPEAEISEQLPNWRFDEAALLLDIDGTLLDIAPTPDSVVVAPGLLDNLRRLRHRLGGALGVITGRPIEQVDALLGDAPHAVAGEHGGAIRLAPGEAIRRPSLPEPPEDWLVQAQALADSHPGVMLERKRRGFVLHFRAAPEAGSALGTSLTELIADAADRFQLMPAHMAWEVKPRGADKGTAAATLLGHPPFTGRKPIFIGDDVTDEDAIRVALAAGGAGLRVDQAFGNPAGVRAWLARLAAVEDGAWAGW